jgi:hypothetical protein
MQSVKSQPTFLRNISPISLEHKNKPSNKRGRSKYQAELLLVTYLFFESEDGGDMFLRNVG